MLNDLFGGIVDDFMEKTDEMIDKVEEWKKEEKRNMISNDETSEYQVMGETGEVPDVKEDLL